MLTELVN